MANTSSEVEYDSNSSSESEKDEVFSKFISF